MPRVTVVTAAYNAAPFLAETMDSVLAQTFTDFDYIVVDDGSSDTTADIISGYASHVVSIRQENAGEGAARNRGFELASGDYVAIVDADDVWEPRKLERQVAAMDQSPKSGLCYTNASTIRADGSISVPLMVQPHRQLTCMTALTGGNPIVTSSVLYRREYLEDRPYGTSPIAADYHVHLKVLWRCEERAVFIDEPLVRYRVVDTSALRSVDAWNRGRLTLKAVEAFVDDMREEKPVPRDLERRGVAYAHFQWAWYCIQARDSYGFAMRQLLHAMIDDWRLGPLVVRQFAKMGLFRLGVR